MKPPSDSYYLITLHFVMHGQHHKVSGPSPVPGPAASVAAATNSWEWRVFLGVWLCWEQGGPMVFSISLSQACVSARAHTLKHCTSTIIINTRHSALPSCILPQLEYSLTHSFIQRMLIRYLLRARHYARHQ
jgi:hypothetical protein